MRFELMECVEYVPSSVTRVIEHLPIQHRTIEQTCSVVLSGDFIAKATPVPIPNTVVKLCEPMIVYTNAKVGIAGLFKTPLVNSQRGFFVDFAEFARRCYTADWSTATMCQVMRSIEFIVGLLFYR
jgi:hypothetical protein